MTMAEVPVSPTGRFHESIQQLVNRQQYELWFKSLQVLSVDDALVRFSVANEFVSEWLSSYYSDVIREAIEKGLEAEPAFELVVAAREAAVTAAAAPQPRPTGPLPAPSQQDTTEHNHRFFLQHSDVVLNPKYTFENFVAGPSNQLAHAAAMAVAGAPAGSYNPLFLHGAVGLGKTHLLQAICHEAMQSGQSMNVLYLSSETFVNQFISAIGEGELDRFRYKYRNVDILLIDDIHLLANKERTQDEFFHTFNALYNAGRQIVLSSDSPPTEIPTLKERLISRFKWGLVAEIAAPGYETRLAILRRKAHARGSPVPEEVLAFLAENIDTNIRELEGAITKVVGYAQLIDQSIDLGLARRALGYRDGDRGPSSTGIERILDVVCKDFGVRIADLQGRKRTQSIAFPRQVAMFLARSLTPLSLEEIGGHFGGRDHSTVLYAVDKIKNRVGADQDFAHRVRKLEKQAQH
jgi:chromosomal replication initiator protein